MPTFNITSIPGIILKVRPESYYVKAGAEIIEIPKEQLDNNPRVPLPNNILDTHTNRIKEGCKISMVKLEFSNGSIRFALNEKVYNDFVNYNKTDNVKNSDIYLKEMLEDMNKQADLYLEFIPKIILNKTQDENQQIREIIKHCVGGANSQLNMLRLYLGLSNINGICTAPGIQEDLKVFGNNFDIDKFQHLFFNMTKQLTSSSFLMCIRFNVIQYYKSIIIRIDVDNRSKGIILYGNRELYVRIGNLLQRIDDNTAFLDFIKQSLQH